MLSITVGCESNGGLNNGGSGGSGGTTKLGPSVNCIGDADNPGGCSFWNCTDIPAAFSKKIHCEGGPTGMPPGVTPPTGPYTCPTSNPLYCPSGSIGGGSGPWTCVPLENGQFQCERAEGPGGGGGGTSGGVPPTGWNCVTSPNQSMSCFTTDCSTMHMSPCLNGTPNMPPGQPPPGGFNCIYTENGEVCRSAPPGPDQVCPTAGAYRWCDGPNFCSWGKQQCVAVSNGVYQWGPCIEGDPKNPPNPAPDSACSCYYPYSYNPKCCEQTDCIVRGQRDVPCPGVGTGLCSPCGPMNACPSGMYCGYGLTYALDPNAHNASVPVFEQFCTKDCTTNADCGAGMNCSMVPGSAKPFCTPQSGTCYHP